MIAQSSIEEVIDIARVEDIVNEFVHLRKSGSNLKGLCPFHNEKTPSFMVSPSKNIYKCFGCGKGGNPVQFVMEHEGFSFPDAIRYLADKYNIKLVESQKSEEAQVEDLKRESLFLINDYAAAYFTDNLLNTQDGKAIGLSYFKGRGYREGTIEKFQLGFALRDRKHFLEKATQTGYKVEQLQQLGLVSKKENDFFSDRVMFPIHNLSGKIIAFAGRTLSKDKKTPKYINSPESPIYEKRKILYGMHLAKQSMRKLDECILVEGYTDVISLHQAGISNVVASSGTSLTEGQVSLIKRYSKTIKVLYDGDQAGLLAAVRGVDVILEQDLDVKIIVLPEGEDPDSYVQNVGTEAFTTFIEDQAKDFIFFKLELLQKEVGNDPIKKTKMVKSIVHSISRIPDQLKRTMYIKECSNLLAIQEEVLINETNKALQALLKEQDLERKRTQAQFNRSENIKPLVDATTTPRNQTETLHNDHYQERDLIRLMISAGHEIYDKATGLTVGDFIMSNIEDIVDLFDNQVYKKILEERHTQSQEGKNVTSQYFINHRDQEISQIAVDVLSSPYNYANWEDRHMPLQTQPMPEQNYVKDCLSSILRLKERKLHKSKEQIENLIKNSQDNSSEEYYILLKGYQRAKSILSDIQSKLGTVIPTK